MIYYVLHLLEEITVFHLAHFIAAGVVAAYIDTADRDAALAWFKDRADVGRITIQVGNRRARWHVPGVKRLGLRNGKTPMETSK
jgi:hypothetical protein